MRMMTKSVMGRKYSPIVSYSITYTFIFGAILVSFLTQWDGVRCQLNWIAVGWEGRMSFTRYFIKKPWSSLDSAAPMLRTNHNSKKKLCFCLQASVNKVQKEGRSVIFFPLVFVHINMHFQTRRCTTFNRIWALLYWGTKESSQLNLSSNELNFTWETWSLTKDFIILNLSFWNMLISYNVRHEVLIDVDTCS